MKTGSKSDLAHGLSNFQCFGFKVIFLVLQTCCYILIDLSGHSLSTWVSIDLSLSEYVDHMILDYKHFGL